MKLSARNVIEGIVKNIDIGAVNVEVEVEVASGVIMTSIITKKSCESLNLAVGKEACIVVKASDVMIAIN